MTLFGVDLSDFDAGRGPVDVAAMAHDGMTFLTHKATEGTRTKHTRYGTVLGQARAANIEFLGAYVVPRTPGNGGHGSITAQVDYFLSYVDQQTPWWKSWPGWFWQVDTEHWSNSQGVVYDAVAPAYGVEMCRLLRERTGRRVVHYAPRWSYGDSIGGTDPLWSSNYGTNPVLPYRQAYPGDNSSRWVAYSGRTPVFLQYGSKCTVGTQPGCDANAYRGTPDQLRALITTTTTMATMEADMLDGYDGNYRDGYTRSEGMALKECWTALNWGTGSGGGGTLLGDLYNEVRSLAAGQAESAKREAAMLAALQALAAGGTSVDTAALIAVVREVGEQESAAIAILQADLDEMQRARRAAAQAEAAALGNE